MSDQYLGEIRIFAGNYAPFGWALCNGQLLPISQNTALFSLLGTYYGGDGRSTFALPNLQSAFPMHQGQGPGLSPRGVGESGGQASVTLTAGQMPVHRHTLQSASSATTGTPNGSVALATASASAPIYRSSANTTTMAAQSIAASGGGQPHNNLPPYLTLTFIIAMQGYFPPRS